MATSSSSTAIRPGSPTCSSRRPPDLSADEIAGFLEGLPRRYLQLFTRDAIYGHVRLARDLRPDDVQLSLERRARRRGS